MSAVLFLRFCLACALSPMPAAGGTAESCANGQQASCAIGTALMQKKHAASNVFADLAEDQDTMIGAGPDSSTKDQFEQEQNHAVGCPDDHSIIVADEPDNSSLDDKEATLEKAYNQFDKDDNGRLDVDELQHGLFSHNAFDKASAGGSLNTTTASLRASREEVEAFVRASASTNGSMTLTLDEFKAAMADNAPQNISLVQTTVIDKCISSISKSVHVPNGCVGSRHDQECWKSWEFWKGDFWECRWKTVTVLVGCLKNIVTQAIAAFGDCFNGILDEVANRANADLKSFARLIPRFYATSCYDVNSCKDSLLKAGPLLLNEIEKGANAIFKGLLGAGELGKGISIVQKLAPKIPPLVKDLAPLVVRSGRAIANFFTGSLRSIRSIADSIDICTPPGKGWFAFDLSDCGSFAALQHLFDNGHKLWEIPGNFESVVTKFGECLIKNNLLSLPTPFLDVSHTSFCLPQFLQVPIKSVVGAFIYFFNQLKATGSGCSGRGGEEPICKMVQEMKGIGERLASVFTDAFSLAQTADAMNEALNGSQQVYRADCAGADFKVFIEFGVGVAIPQVTESGGKLGSLQLGVGLEFMTGCRSKKPFVDLVFGIGMDRGIFQNPKDIEPSVSFARGFEIDTPQSSIVDVAVQAKLVGEVDLAPIPAFGNGAVGAELGFKVMPELNYPKGFKAGVVLAPEDGAGLLQAEIDKAAYDAKGPEEIVGSALGLAINHLAGANIEGIARGAIPQPQETLRAGAIAMNEIGASMQKKDKKLDLVVGLEFKFCLTCHLWGGFGGCRDKKSPSETPWDCGYLTRDWMGGQGCAGTSKDFKHVIAFGSSPGLFTTSEICPESCGLCDSDQPLVDLGIFSDECRDKKSPQEIPWDCGWLAKNWMGGQGCTGTSKDVRHTPGPSLPGTFTTMELCPESCGYCTCRDKKSPQEIPWDCGYLTRDWMAGQGCSGTSKDFAHSTGPSLPGTFTTSELCPESCGLCDQTPCSDKESPSEIPWDCGWLAKNWMGGQGCTGTSKDFKHTPGSSLPGTFTTSELCPQSCGLCPA